MMYKFINLHYTQKKDTFAHVKSIFSDTNINFQDEGCNSTNSSSTMQTWWLVDWESHQEKSHYCCLQKTEAIFSIKTKLNFEDRWSNCREQFVVSGQNFLRSLDRYKISKHNNRSLDTPKWMNCQKSFKQPLTPPPPLFVMPSLICFTNSVWCGHISVKTFQKHISETRNMAYQVGRTWHLPGWRTKCANLPEPATSLEIILRMTEKNANWTVYGLHLGFLIMFISNLIVHCIVWWFLATLPK